MSKQDFIDYTIENSGLYNSLNQHLTCNFYPPLPIEVKKIMLDGFNAYWAGLYDIDGLQNEIKRVYKGSLYDYGFNNYLIHEEVDCYD